MRLSLNLAPVVLALFAPACPAHFHMLLPRADSVRKGEAVTVTYQWGHPFEHQLFDATPPSSLTVLGPDGKKTDLTGTLEKTTRPAGDRKVVAYQLTFTPDLRGDYVFVAQAPPVWMEEDREFLQDTVKVVLHVQAQKGWDAAIHGDFEFVPLTRPYGLQPGMVFQAQVRGKDPQPVRRGRPAQAGRAALLDAPMRPWEGALVEVERYNVRPPAKLPPDEFITRTARTDPNGVVTTTLTEAGWWCLASARPAGNREHEGKTYPVRQRCILWVFVAEKLAGP
jgi:cobalt/nickel transport protein